MTAAVSSTGSSRNHDIFASIFPPPSFTTPTPQATPEIGLLSLPGQAFGGPLASNSIADQVVRISQAWSLVQTCLSHNLPESAKAQTTNPQEFLHCLTYLLQQPRERRLLLRWFGDDVGTHFRCQYRPLLNMWDQPIPTSEATTVISKTISMLHEAQKHYLQDLHLAAEQVSSDFKSDIVLFTDKAKSEFHAQVRSMLPRERLHNTLAHIFFTNMNDQLRELTDIWHCEGPRCGCLLNLDALPLEQLDNVGLGKEVGERALALAVHRLFKSPIIESKCFAVDWSKQASVVPKLRLWLEETCVPAILSGHQRLNQESHQEAALSEQYTLSVIKFLGQLRVTALFDYVKLWPQSTGAVLDLKEYLHCGSGEEKTGLCSSFVRQVMSRLLHAGASTTEILTIYVNVIHVFKMLDPRGVLLDKVAAPVRYYLRSREDTVHVIAASCLVNLEMKQENGRVNDSTIVSAHIAYELAKAETADSQRHMTLNWSDMEWHPDPIDAGPDYKATKSEDVMSYVLGLFDSDDFIKEVTKVLAQHLLLSKDPEHGKETRLVEFMKTRFDSTKLQAAEVMLKDMRDSAVLNRKLNPTPKRNQQPPTPREIQAALPEEGITLASLYEMFANRIDRPKFHAALKLVATKRQDLFFPKRGRLPPEPPKTRAAAGIESDSLEMQVKVVSGFFWPPMRSENFRMPTILTTREQAFTQGFETLSGQRKLAIRNMLSRVTVELELEDRKVIEEDVAGYRACVLDVFAENSTCHDDASMALDEAATTDWSVATLSTILSMDEELVTDALNFWTSKRILYQSSPTSWSILERLDLDTGVSAPPPAPQAQEVSTIISQDAIFREGAPMFKVFISNMLKNGGAKEIAGMMGITNMLKMVLPTFTYGDGEVRTLLEELEAGGEVARNGEMWSAKG